MTVIGFNPFAFFEWPGLLRCMKTLQEASLLLENHSQFRKFSQFVSQFTDPRRLTRHPVLDAVCAELAILPAGRRSM